MSDKIINKNIMNENIIEKEELIQYLTWILDHDGELEKFYDWEGLREEEDDPVPDVLGFRDWLKEQTFEYMIRSSYFEEYIKESHINMGDYNPDCWLHKHLNWEVICEEQLEIDYDSVFDNEDDHPFDIFGEEFYYLIHD